MAALIVVLALVASLFGAPPAFAVTGHDTITGRIYLGTTAKTAGAGEVSIAITKANQPTWTATTTTDSAGNYSFTGLDYVSYAIEASYIGAGSYPAKWEVAGLTIPNSTFSTVIPPTYTVAGRVALDTAGNYAAAGVVRVTAVTGSLPYPTVLTDADGRYSFGKLLSTKYVLLQFEYLGTETYPVWFYSSDGRGSPDPTGGFFPAADNSNYDVIVGAGVSLSGRLLTTSGAPWAHHLVVIGSQTGQSSTNYHYARTDSNGYYRIHGLPNGWTYWVTWGDEDGDGIAYGEAGGGHIFKIGNDYIPANDQWISGPAETVYTEATITASATWPSSLNSAMDHGIGNALYLVEWLDPETSEWNGYWTFGRGIRSSTPSSVLGELAPGTYRLSVDYNGEDLPAFEPQTGAPVVVAEGAAVAVSFSLSQAPWALGVPTNLVAPSVSGSYFAGEAMTVDVGAWTGNPSFSIFWLRCTQPVYATFTTLPSGCSAIVGARASSYTPTMSDVGYYVTAQIAGNGGGGFSLAGARNDSPIYSPYPSSTTPTIVVGASAVGSTWTAQSGRWTPDPQNGNDPAFTYSWMRCSQPVADPATTVPGFCSMIPGASSSTYVSTEADSGKYLTAVVAGTGAAGAGYSVARTTVMTDVVRPKNTVAPTVSGASTAGSTWTATVGTWTGVTSTAIYWVRCSAVIADVFTTLPAGCSAIPGAMGTTYMSTAADAGKYLTVQVAGNGTTGFALAGAPNATAIVSTAPTNTGLPIVSGSASVGSTWTATAGTWTGVTSTAVYWIRCAAPVTVAFTTLPAGCSSIPGATGLTYVATAADGGKYLTVQVAGNGVGFALAGALNSTAIISTSPKNTVPPTVSGSASVGSTWTATAGTWTGVTSTPVYWIRCAAPITVAFTTLPAGCSAIPGATGLNYVSTVADGGKYLTVQVAGNGASGFALAGALNSTAIVSTALANTAPPTVSGSSAIGSTWTATAGTWTGTISTAVYWVRCAALVAASFTTLPASCSAIPGATGLTYVATPADAGKYLSVQVAGNGASGFALSGAINATAIEGVAYVAPANTALPTVSGAAPVGSSWTATSGSWVGVNSTAVYWLRCSAPITSGFTTVPAGCSVIPGAVGASYTSTSADTGKYLTVQVGGNGPSSFALAGALNSIATE